MQSKLDITQDIQPLTTFRNNSVKMIKHLLDIAAEADEREGVRPGHQDIAAARTKPAKKVFDEIRKQHGLQR
jgi:hypothetical protein